MNRPSLSPTLLLTAVTGIFIVIAPLTAAGDFWPPAGDAAAAVAPDRSVPADTAYKIGPGDVLSVYIWREPDASSASVKVRADGVITLRLIGELAVAGLSLHDVQQELVKRYSIYLRDPVITLNIEDTNSQIVYIVGEVKKSGSLHFVAPLTVLQAIAEAGGLSDFAKRNRIYILRSDEKSKLFFDYDAVIKGRRPEQNVVLQKGDTVVVPR